MSDVVVLHPGAMGSRLAGELRSVGHKVGWVAEGRSEATEARAAREGLRAVAWSDLSSAEIIVSSCAPQGAVEVGERVAESGFTGLYLEANPLAPPALTCIGELFPPPARFVDGAIIGPPPGRAAGATHLLLSGPPEAVAAAELLWDGTRVVPLVAGEPIGAASAAKSAYALFAKGRLALAVLARALARRAGVVDVLQEQRDRPGAADLVDPELEAQLREVAWRWGPEFDEIASTLQHHGLSPQAASMLRRVWTDLADGNA